MKNEVVGVTTAADLLCVALEMVLMKRISKMKFGQRFWKY